MKRYSIVGMEHRKAEDFVKNLQPGADATLVREPTNQFDPNAVAVWINGRKVGFIPKAQNKVLAQFIDQQGRGYNVDKLLAMDAGLDGRAVDAKFVRSPNSNYPMVEV